MALAPETPATFSRLLSVPQPTRVVPTVWVRARSGPHLADLVAEADLPPGVLNIVPGGRDVGESLVSHPKIDKVSFTGSTAAGRQVALACAAGLKQVSLELGGKSAAIVLDDADPSTAAAGIQMASLANSGQVCNALSRILVPAARKGPAHPNPGAAGSGGNGSGPRVPFVTA